MEGEDSKEGTRDDGSTLQGTNRHLHSNKTRVGLWMLPGIGPPLWPTVCGVVVLFLTHGALCALNQHSDQMPTSIQQGLKADVRELKEVAAQHTTRLLKLEDRVNRPYAVIQTLTSFARTMQGGDASRDVEGLLQLCGAEASLQIAWPPAITSKALTVRITISPPNGGWQPPGGSPLKTDTFTACPCLGATSLCVFGICSRA